MKGLLIALGKPGKGAPPKSPGTEEEASEPGAAEDYKQMAKDAAKDGDWDAMVDALCTYFESDKD